LSAEDEAGLLAMEQSDIGQDEPEIVIAQEIETPLENDYAGEMDVEETASGPIPEPVYTITQKTGYGWFKNQAYPINKDGLIEIEKNFTKHQIRFNSTATTSKINIESFRLDEKSSDMTEQNILLQKETRSEQENILIKRGAHLINQVESPGKVKLIEFQKKFQYGISEFNLDTQKEKSKLLIELDAEEYVPGEYPSSETLSVEQDLPTDPVIPALSVPESAAVTETPEIVQETIETTASEQEDESDTQPVRPFIEEDIPLLDPFSMDFEIPAEEFSAWEIDKTEDRAETIFDEAGTIEFDPELDNRLQTLLSGLETKPADEETNDFQSPVDAAKVKEGKAEQQQDSQALLEKDPDEYFKKMPAEDLDENDEVLFLDDNFDILSLGQKPLDRPSTPSESDPEKMLDFFLREASILEDNDKFIEQDTDAPPKDIEGHEPSEIGMTRPEESIQDVDQLPEEPDERKSMDEEVITTLHSILSHLEAEVNIEPQQADVRTEVAEITPVDRVRTDTTVTADSITTMIPGDSIHEPATSEAAPKMEDFIESISAKTEFSPAFADEESVRSQQSLDEPHLDEITIPEYQIRSYESPDQKEKETKISLDEDLFRMLIELNEDQDEQTAIDEKIEISETLQADITEEIDPQSKQDDENAQSVIIDVLSQMDEIETDEESLETKQIAEKPIITKSTESDEQSSSLDLRIPISPRKDGELDQSFDEEISKMRKSVFSEKPSIQPEQDLLLDDNLLPWEKEGLDRQSDQEITPTISASLEEESTQNILLEMLAETQTESIVLSAEFPVYTCILIPELSDYRLSSRIARKLKLWIPQLCLAFGWQLENLLVQPTYMQWTVRVPPNTSQGMIVRKIRQRTSYRLFYEFPDLIGLSQTANFWAKGYLVVSGNEPPTPEYLDDFIRKNRQPKSFIKP
ncbi:MAG: transposase, partial [Anaerolineaceae bacterium]|nr:transposase [Anaerolineaceae bacterium]